MIVLKPVLCVLLSFGFVAAFCGLHVLLWFDPTMSADIQPMHHRALLTIFKLVWSRWLDFDLLLIGS